jgi:copper transport protein
VLGAVALLAAAPFRIARIGGGLDALRDNAVIEASLRGPIGQATVVGAVALLALAVAVDQRAAGWVLLAVSAVALAGFALEGHSRAEQRGAMIASDVVHLAAGAVWLGGVAGLLVAFRSALEPGRLALLVRRFSQAALGAVLVVSAAGTVMAWIILPSLDELTGTGWGLALVTKVAVVLVVIAIGAYNNRRLVPRFDGLPGGWSARHLGRTLVAEAVLLLAVVGIAAVLVTRSPISTAAPPPPSATELVVELSDGGTLELAVTPAGVGPNRIEAVLRDVEGRIVNPLETPELSLTQDELGIGPLSPELSPVSIGEYEANTELCYAGDWEVAVRVRVSDFESIAGAAMLAVTQ